VILQTRGDAAGAARCLLAAGDTDRAFSIVFEAAHCRADASDIPGIAAFVNLFPRKLVTESDSRMLTYALMPGLAGQVAEAHAWLQRARMRISDEPARGRRTSRPWTRCGFSPSRSSRGRAMRSTPAAVRSTRAWTAGPGPCSRHRVPVRAPAPPARPGGRKQIAGRIALPEMTVISVLSSSPSGHGSDQPPDLVIGVHRETGKGLHHPAEQAACRERQRRLAGYVRIVTRQLGVCGSDAASLQSCTPLLPICVPAIAECARAVVL
jgi:hypothetical protein